MRHKALPYLLPALQSLPPLLSSLYAELGFRRTRLRAENRFRRRVVPTIGYTQTMIAPRLQAQLSPWLRELLEAPELAGRIFERFVLEMPAAVQEAMHWAYAFEVGTRLVATADAPPRLGTTRDLRVLFVPLVCEQANWAPTLPPLLMRSLRELLYTQGVVQPDEAVLVAPASLPPTAVTRLTAFTRLIEFALDGAESAWGPELAPAADLTAAWARWWRRPEAVAGAPTLRPLEVRLALLVVISPDPADRLLDALAPWQQEARTELLLADRFDSGAVLEFDSEADLSGETQRGFIDWIDTLNQRLQEAGIATVVAAPPSDAYTACGRGAVEVACQFVRAHEAAEGEASPIFLIGDSTGLAVELGGASLRLPWAPEGLLMPAMLPVIDEVVQATMQRRVERSVVQDLERLVLIGPE